MAGRWDQHLDHEASDKIQSRRLPGGASQRLQSRGLCKRFVHRLLPRASLL